MADEQESFASMGDEDFEASLLADYGADEPAETESDDAGEGEESRDETGEADYEANGEEQGAPEGDETGETEGEQEQEGKEKRWKPESDTDPRAWADKEREQRKALQRELAETQARLQAYEDAQRKAEADRQQAEYDAWFKDELDKRVDPDEQAAFVQAERDRLAKHDRQQVQQERVNERLSMSIQLMRDLHPDFGDVTQRAVDALGHDVLNHLAMKNNPLNPAKWAYDYAKEKFPTPEELDARIRAEAEKLAQEVLRKKQDGKQGHKTIARGTSSTAGKLSNKPARKQSDDELERSLRA